MTAPDPVRLLLAAEYAALCRERALQRVCRVGLPVALLAGLWGLLARLVVLPDLALPVAALVVVVTGIAAGSAWLSPGPPGAARLRAGRDAGEPSLFLALEARASALHPLLLARARQAAETTLAGGVSRGTRPRFLVALPGALLLALLLVAAPGRRVAPAPLDPARAALARREAAGLAPDVAALASLDPDAGSAALQLEHLAGGGLDPAATEAAHRILEAVAQRVREDAVTAADLLAVQGVLEPADPSRVSAELRDLARRLRLGEVQPAALERAGAALSALAGRLADPARRERAAAAARGLAADAPADAARALESLAGSLESGLATAARIEGFLVLLSPSPEGSGASAAHAAAGSTPGVPEAGPARRPSGPPALVRYRETPEHEVILSRYFQRR